MKESKKLRRSLIVATLALFAALFSVSAATFAWYIYQTSARTTKVEMAAGSSVSLQIAKEEEGPYKSSIDMDETDKFEGRLNPVSTDKISGGFQRAERFDRQEDPETGEEQLFAALFGQAEARVDYHKTYLYLLTGAPQMDIYLSDIGFVDADELRPISTALRVGFVVDGGEEFIFEVNPAQDANRGDNGDRVPGDDHVLDSSKTDGSTVPFTPLNRDNFCDYNSDTGVVTLKPDSRKLCTITENTPVRIDVYLWLEGCDLDCSLNLVDQTLKNLALSFAGYTGEGG